MGIGSASATFARFLVPETPVEDFWTFVADGLHAGVFRECEETVESASGFASFDDLFDTALEYASWHKGDYVTAAFRTDTRKVPPVILKQHVREAIRKRREAEGRWPTRSEKLEIRDFVSATLLARVLPRPSSFEWVWEPARRILLLGTTGAKPIETFLDHFERHFRVYPVPLHHANWGLHLLPLTRMQRDVLSSLVPADSVRGLAEGRFLGYEFLTWLWWFTEHGSGGVALPNGTVAALHLGERLVLSRPDDGKERVICTSEAGALDEAREALRRGKLVEEAQFAVHVAENEYLLTLDTSLMSVKGLRCPKQLPEEGGAEDPEGRFLERMYFIEEVFSALDALYGQFLSERLSPSWESEARPALLAWMNRREEPPAAAGAPPF